MTDRACANCKILESQLIEYGEHGLIQHKDRLLCRECRSREHKKAFYRIPVVYAVRDLLRALTLDVNDPNFAETPRRLADLLIEFSGATVDFEKELEEICSAVFPHSSSGLIVSQSIETYALCPHHLLPVHYVVAIGYLPKGYAIGVSKLSRLVDLLSKKSQLQETYTQEVAKTLSTHLKTPDVAVVVKGEHYCMKMRGTKSNGSIVVSEMLGDFQESQNLRAEFLSLAGVR